MEKQITGNIRESTYIFLLKIVSQMFLSIVLILICMFLGQFGLTLIASIISFIIFIITVFLMVSAVLRWYTHYYYFTENEIVYKTGVLGFSEKSVLFKEVESVNVNLSLLGRILNFGTIAISGDTAASTMTLTNVAKPRELGEKIEDLTAVNLKLKKLSNN